MCEMVRSTLWLKYISLAVLTVHSALLIMSMRYARTKNGNMFHSSTAVILPEIVKFMVCLGLVFREQDREVKKLMNVIKQQIIQQPRDTFKVCVPSMLYIVQNNLMYASVSHLDAATFQVTYQLKIIVTAIFSVTILNKNVTAIQWGALFFLLSGVVMVQLADTSPNVTKPLPVEQNRFLGLAAALGACILSAYAGILFEKILKGSKISVWVRNLQLSALSLPLGLFTTFFCDYAAISEKGFFFGYDGFVIYVIFLQAIGGLTVAMVLKYADNILKNFATVLAIVISCVSSIYLSDFVVNAQFVLGLILVIGSIYLYNCRPHNAAKPSYHII